MLYAAAVQPAGYRTTLAELHDGVMTSSALLHVLLALVYCDAAKGYSSTVGLHLTFRSTNLRQAGGIILGAAWPMGPNPVFAAYKDVLC